MKNVLIVGGSSGIGYEIIKSLSEQNYKIYALTRAPETLDNLSGVFSFKYDVQAKEKPLPDQIPEVIDGFIYAPGTVNLRPFHRIKPEEYQKDLEINFLGAVRVLQGIYKNLKKSEHASIVFFSSVAVQTGMPYHAAISASKGAVEGLTRALAAELAPKIRVNAVAPSMTDTKLAARFLGSDENRKKYDNNHPLKRVGKPGDIMEAVVFLLSDKSSWMTGQILHVDGGMSSVKLL